MLGAIAGDIIGSVFEQRPIKTTSFALFSEQSRFTDDTVLTVAVAHAILSGKDYGACLKQFGRQFPFAGYGMSFFQWLFTADSKPYYSWGNGSAMRVSPVGFAFQAPEAVLREAHRSAAVTHDHPEGIKGAQAVALAIYLARQGASKAQIQTETQDRIGYDLTRRLDDIRPGYRFDISCQGSVPESMIAFLEADHFEAAVRNAVSLGGDSDTMGCIAGGIAQAFYREIPAQIVSEVRRRLPDEFLAIIDDFDARYGLL